MGLGRCCADVAIAQFSGSNLIFPRLVKYVVARPGGIHQGFPSPVEPFRNPKTHRLPTRSSHQGIPAKSSLILSRRPGDRSAVPDEP